MTNLGDTYHLSIPIRAYSINSFHRHGGRHTYITASGRTWRNKVIEFLQQNYPDSTHWFTDTDRLKISYRFYFTGSRECDTFNYEKPLTDTIEEANIIPNDKQIDIGTVARFYKAKKNGVYVEIQKITEIPFHPADEFFL